MVRSRRPLTWWQLPGVVAAYQFVVAPDYPRMLRNVAPSGGYTLTSPAYPGWTMQNGATFNGSTQWLDSGILPTATTSALVRFSDASAYDVVVFGSYSGNDTTRFTYYSRSGLSNAVFEHADSLPVAGGGSSAGVAAIAGQQGYLNGSTLGGTIPGTWSGTATATIGIAKQNGFFAFGNCNVQAVLIAERTLSPAEVALASHQMAYCEYNPAWNAWAPERRYFVMAPAAAGGAATMNTYFRRMRS